MDRETKPYQFGRYGNEDENRVLLLTLRRNLLVAARVPTRLPYSDSHTHSKHHHLLADIGTALPPSAPLASSSPLTEEGSFGKATVHQNRDFPSRTAVSARTCRAALIVRVCEPKSSDAAHRMFCVRTCVTNLVACAMFHRIQSKGSLLRNPPATRNSNQHCPQYPSNRLPMQ